MLSVWRSLCQQVRNIKKTGEYSINIITKVPISRSPKAPVIVRYQTKSGGFVRVYVCRCAQACMEKSFLFNSQYSGVIRCLAKGAGRKTQHSSITESPAYLYPAISLPLFNFYRQLQSYTEWCKGCCRLTGTLLAYVIIILAVIFILISNGIFLAKRSGGGGSHSSDHTWSWLSAV